MAERITDPGRSEEEVALEQTLRPRRLAEFSGQKKVVEQLRIAIAAAQQRHEPLDHVLLYGPPGLGKTTLAMLLATEMGVSARITSGPAIERPGDLAALLTNLAQGDVLFIDEVHRLHHSVEEVLYPAMEDYALDLVIGRGPGARSVRLKLPPFTLVGATTRYSMISAPLRDRFTLTHRLDFYTPEDLTTILRRDARILGIAAEPSAIAELARRARGTVRIGIRLLKRARDYAQVRGDGEITQEIVRECLDQLEVDELGLDPMDRTLLGALIVKFDGRAVGLGTLAAAISEEPDTVENVYEPYLLQLGFLERTPRGRKATRLAYVHLGHAEPEPQSAIQQGRLL